MFTLAKREDKATNIPYFPMSKESDPREGFVERPEFEKVRAEMPVNLHAALTLCYETGCRTGAMKQSDTMEAAMRLAGRERLGFYPLPAREAERIRRFLVFPDKQCCALDPCVGDGAAFAEIASDKNVQRYGVELDAGRAEQARSSGIDVIHGNCSDAQCPMESFSLIYLNPPYDFEISEEKSQRMEKLFLEHVYRCLIRGGILVFVVPAK